MKNKKFCIYYNESNTIMLCTKKKEDSYNVYFTDIRSLPDNINIPFLFANYDIAVYFMNTIIQLNNFNIHEYSESLDIVEFESLEKLQKEIE